MRTLAALVTIAWLLAPPALGQSASPEAIKAAFIYNFARFTVWPDSAFPSATAPLNVCAPPDSPLVPALREIDGKAVGAHRFTVSTDGGARCHVRIYQGGTPSVIEHALLTVGDTPGFIQRGGAIGLVQVGRQIRFGVNTNTVEQAGLSISSKLLRLALEIER